MAASARLARIQAALERLYDVRSELRVDDFLCDEEFTETVAPQATERGEVLLVTQREGDLSVGLYLSDTALAELDTLADGDDAWLDERFGSACLVTEGVSHFVYLVFRANDGGAVSLLELELQAEVDKYATALLAGNGVGAIRERSRAIRGRLFADAKYLDAAGTEEGDRYRLATRLAARFAERLEREHLGADDLDGLARTLRRFYRLGAREKIEAIG